MSSTYPESGGGGLGQRSADGQDLLKRQASEAAEKLADARETVAGEAAHFAENVRETVTTRVDETKDQVTDALSVFADAIRKAGDELNGQDQSFAGKLAGQAADGLQALSRNLAGKSPEAMLESARELGRTNPTALLFGAVLAGVAVGRFARSSAHHQHDGSQASRETMELERTADAATGTPVAVRSAEGLGSAPQAPSFRPEI